MNELVQVVGQAFPGSLSRPRNTRDARLVEAIGTYSVVLAIVVATIFLLDPTGGMYTHVEEVPAVKYLPIELIVFALPWFIAGRPRRIPVSTSFTSVAALGLLVLGGGAYTVLFQGHAADASFLGRGLDMLALFTGYYAALQPKVWNVIATWLWRLGLAAGITMFGALLVWRLGYHFVDEAHIYHEEIFVSAAAAVALYGKPGSWFPKAILTPVLLGACLLSMKNTGFLAAAIAGTFISMIVWQQHERHWVSRLAKRTVVVFAILTAVGLAVAAVVLVPQNLPNGTPALRLVTYGIRYKMFLSSPIVGTWFTGDPNINLGYRVVQSHSDVLDLIAFGGSLGVLLAFPIILVVIRAAKHVVAPGGARTRSRTYVWTLIPLIVMEMMVNPIWHHPYISPIFWLAVGGGLAIMSRATPSTATQSH